mgnify:CR=1 FL=1
MAEQKKSSAKAMILPPLVLAVICAVCCAFLAHGQNMVTKDKDRCRRGRRHPVQLTAAAGCRNL